MNKSFASKQVIDMVQATESKDHLPKHTSQKLIIANFHLHANINMLKHRIIISQVCWTNQRLHPSQW